MSIFDNYEQELLAAHAATKDADREADTARWVKRRQEEIAAGLRNAEGEWIGPDLITDEEPENDDDDTDEGDDS